MMAHVSGLPHLHTMEWAILIIIAVLLMKLAARKPRIVPAARRRALRYLVTIRRLKRAGGQPGERAGHS